MNILSGAVTAEKEENIGTDAVEDQGWHYENGLSRFAAKSEKMFEV